MFGGIKVNENWRKQNNKELMQLVGDVDMHSFVRISQLNWIVNINRVDITRKVSQVFNNNFEGSQPRWQPKTR
jgi:hypothetical protein